MINTYQVTGMTCSGCAARLKEQLSKVPGVQAVTVDLSRAEASVDARHPVSVDKLSAALNDYPQYKISEISPQPGSTDQGQAETKTWFETYKPLLLIFAYLLGITLVPEFSGSGFAWKNWMPRFMAAFFLVFSFFKLLDLRGFAGRYAGYDLLARRWPAWSYLYVFLELGLGIAFLTGFHPIFSNAAALVLMSVSLTGVLRAVFSKRKIQCACLGAVFQLPMSTVTLVEDGLMIGMSGAMLLSMV